MAKVLVIDDDHTISAAIAVRLEHHGYLVRTCHSARQAADLVLRERPDAILLDVEMPHYNGLELHECLLITDRGRGIPIIYLTGQQNEFVKRRAMEMGAAAYLEKPYDPNMLLETLRKVVATTGNTKGQATPAALPRGEKTRLPPGQGGTQGGLPD